VDLLDTSECFVFCLLYYYIIYLPQQGLPLLYIFQKAQNTNYTLTPAECIGASGGSGCHVAAPQMQEVVEGTRDLHGKLPLESCSGTLEKLRARGVEDDIFDVEKQVCNVCIEVVDDVRNRTLTLIEREDDTRS
jgi:hypothetical protein